MAPARQKATEDVHALRQLGAGAICVRSTVLKAFCRRNRLQQRSSAGKTSMRSNPSISGMRYEGRSYSP